MENVSSENKLESIKSLQSTISKSEKALTPISVMSHSLASRTLL